MSILNLICYNLLLTLPICPHLIKTRILKQCTVNIVIFDPRKYPLLLLRHPPPLLLTFELLYKVLIIHRDHPLHRCQKVPCINLNLCRLLQHDLALLLVYLIEHQRAYGPVIPADLPRGYRVQLDHVVRI